MASTSIQTVPTSFTSDFSKPQPEYDVFLSFSGEDTRYKFTDHLYHALVDKKIITFRDDKELKMGEPISLELLMAIEKSRIAVIVFSENYASSPWCMEELTKIDECRKRRILTVLPIFCYVEPSDVRRQKNTFAQAFAKLEKRFEENPKKVQNWRAALTNVASLSGKHLKDGSESEFIRSIVDQISSELKDKFSIVYEDGFDEIVTRVEEIILCLDMNSNDVRFIGICGESGMGKTTVAREVFDEICNQFDACSFLENVEEVSEARGLKTLQEQLLCDISKRELDYQRKESKGALRVRDMHNGTQLIRNVLRGKKVLIVVDDVCEVRKLKKLVGNCDWFGPRSRIIVTTEDKHLLESYKIQTVCRATRLNNDEALRLFSHYAYDKAHCENELLDWGKDFVTYAPGIPLVLKVLGSYLFKRSKGEWESALNQLKEIPYENILGILQIAYNGLGESEKILFLDIACFFIGEDQNRVADILESSEDDMKKLIEKSLITIVGGKLCMHTLIKQMGRKIIHDESMELGRQSRLWHCDVVLDVLKTNTGTENIEGMVLNLTSNEEQEELNAEPFSKMSKLRLLKICKLKLPCLSYLSNELRSLEWHEYPFKSFPKSFQPRKLVELIMQCSSINQFPREFNHIDKLKLIDLSNSENLCQTPNFSGLPNIERLIFQGCTGLHALHPSVGGLKRLILLNLKDCKCLENLPHEINLESLKILILSGCSKLKKIPKIGRNMKSMLELYLDRTAIEELPSSIKHLTGLTLLNLQDCENLSSFPSVICSLESLKILILSGCKGQPPKARHLLGLISTLSSICATLTLPYTCLIDRQPEPEPISLLLPELFSGLSSLVSLDLSDCNLLDGDLPDDLSYLSSLTFLNLRNNNFTRLPDSISQLLNLKLLSLDNCSKLKPLPYIPLSAQFVLARGCTSLEDYSNQVVIWTSGAERLITFINCHGLADNVEAQFADAPSLNIHIQSLWQRYMEDQIHQIKGFCLVVPQTEIPQWFKNQECGPSVRIPIPSNLFNNKSWKGIALCVIFVVPPNSKNVYPRQDSNYFHEFICQLDVDGSFLNCPLVIKVPKETFVGSFGLWLYISHARFTEHFNEGSCISSLIRPKMLDIQVKMCGARILYEQDMVEFVQNSRQENFRSCNDLGRGHEKLIEDHMSNSQGPDPGLERYLKSLLSRLYQVDWAQNHLYDYIFHQIARPQHWFTCQKHGPYVEMQLPPDVHYNSTWLGFTVYALYGIQMQPAGFSYKLDSTILLHYSGLSVSFAPYPAFPLSGDLFDESSQRLVVFYIPRRVFQLNRCNHIRAVFESGDPGVQVEMCGIRPVYEQDVEEFVQSLVEYMLGSPDANHQSISEHLSHQRRILQGCNHEKHYLCPFLPERRPNPMPMVLPNNETVQEECTSRETFSSQVIAAGLECWLKPNFQDHCKFVSTFNCCFLESDIPKRFKQQNNSPSVIISLHSDFYNKPEWIGFAISSVFSFHKNPTTASMKQGSGLSHMVICHLKTNLGCTNPLLYYRIREEDVLASIYQREFRWESIIQRQLLSLKWSQCAWVEFSFISDTLDVSALKCGVELVFQQNLKEFTLAQCITSYNGPSTSNERLPFIGRDKFSDSDSHKDKINGTSGQHSCEGTRTQTAAKDFHPSSSYNCCFPPSKIQYWFSHQNHGHSVTMDLPSNLYLDSNCMGLVLYASFSINGDPNFILSHLNSGKSHSLYCQFQMSMANVDDQIIAFSTSKEEITWLLELGEFIWISYVPGEPFKNMLQHCSRIEASFVSDWPGVIVQKCALQLLYQHDQVQFVQDLQNCNNLISEKETETQLGQSDLQNHQKSSSTFNRCSPQSEIPNWFTNQSNGSSVTIFLPSHLYNKPDWIGFAFAAVFSFHKYPTAARMKQGSGFSHMVICHLKTNLGCMNPLLYYDIREEDVLTSLHQRSFLWESIIQRRLLSPEWSECTWVEFSFVNDSLDVSALKCGVELVFLHNLDEFTLAQCIISYNGPSTSNERLPFIGHDKFSDSDSHEDQTNGTSGQYSYEGTHTRYQLYQTAVKVVFPKSESLELFSMHSEVILHRATSRLTDSRFQNLCNLKVKGSCPLSSSTATFMVQLKYLSVIDFKVMEELLLTEDLGEEQIVPKVLFPRLEYLILKDLPLLKRFCVGRNIKFPSLKDLCIQCPKLESFIFKPVSSGITVSKELKEVNLEEISHTALQPDSSCYVGSWNKDLKIQQMNGNFYPGNGKERSLKSDGNCGGCDNLMITMRKRSSVDGARGSVMERNFPRICIWESDGEAGDITCDIIDNVEVSMFYRHGTGMDREGFRQFRRSPCCFPGEAKRPGQMTSKGHKNYELMMINLQLGIGYSVGKHASILRELKESDFDTNEKFWTRFPPEGSKITPPHQSTEFRWKDYCPMVFRCLRERFQVDPADYMLAICGSDALRELSSPGKSGSCFSLTQDDRFMIKTVRKSEVKRASTGHGQDNQDEDEQIRDIHALTPPQSPPVNCGRRREAWETSSHRSSLSMASEGARSENFTSMSREFSALVVAGSTFDHTSTSNNETEGTINGNKLRNLNSDVKEGCHGCTKIVSKKVVDSSPSEEQLSFNKQKYGSVFPAKRKSVLVQILQSVLPKSVPAPQCNNKVDCCKQGRSQTIKRGGAKKNHN